MTPGSGMAKSYQPGLVWLGSGTTHADRHTPRDVPGSSATHRSDSNTPGSATPQFRSPCVGGSRPDLRNLGRVVDRGCGVGEGFPWSCWNSVSYTRIAITCRAASYTEHARKPPLDRVHCWARMVNAVDARHMPRLLSTCTARLLTI